ncbi:carboxypeptidase Q-like isoform X1 [Calliopsis andreniformis]|uniref:carboxypeptidase Q-like isoform X1 n=1 Tax=Calliopsis andreniformis TaxID=337506 RepID=UPI003FCD28C0
MLRPVKISFFTWLLLIKFVVAVNDTNNNTCVLPPNLIQEIDSYAPLVQSIINETLSGSFKSVTWNELADFVDKFGPRLTGTEVLEKSIDYVLNKSVDFGLENVHGEPVTVPHWVRGQESATLLKPRQKDIALLGLGYSVGTPPEGITAEAIVVNSFKELEERQHEVPGKIVVYNQKYVSYDKTVQYRSKGASVASKYGAVAALIRSVTPYSLYTPHTGMQSYAPNVTKIPVACITAEDASLLKRMANRGYTIQINLKMQAKNLPDKVSRNVIAEIVGSTVPNKVVVVSGHIDSWDVGQGAMDDGGGAFISWQAVRLLKQLKYRPRRTIRMIMWTAEELGIIGARHYIKTHKDTEQNLQFVLESDIGTFMPLGLEFTGVEQVKCILERVMKLLSPMGQMKLRSPNQGPDIADWVNAGVPGGSLWTRNDKYFYYHHTNADTMLVENPDALDRGTALFAAVSYVLADLSIDLPRQK